MEWAIKVIICRSINIYCQIYISNQINLPHLLTSHSTGNLYEGNGLKIGNSIDVLSISIASNFRNPPPRNETKIQHLNQNQSFDMWQRFFCFYFHFMWDFLLWKCGLKINFTVMLLIVCRNKWEITIEKSYKNMKWNP